MTARHNRTIAADRRRTLIRRTAAPLALSVALLTAALGMVQAAPTGLAASSAPSDSAVPQESAVPVVGNSIRIDPPSQTVPRDGTFTAQVVQYADVPTSGAAATITFDPTLVQVQTVTRAAPYAEASIFSGASPQAISAANTTGSLIGVAAAFLPPDAVPAGDAAFLDITFKAIGCGTVQLGLPTGVTDAALLDGSPATYGNALTVSTVGGTVTTCNSIRIDPPSQTVPRDGTFTAQVVQYADVPTSGAAATITFDPTLVQVQTVTRAAPYAEASIFSGASPQAISAANTTGSLIGVAAAFLPPDAVPAGDAAFLDITFKAIGCGTVQLGLPTGVTDAALLDGSPATYGNALTVSTVGGMVTTCVIGSPAPSGSGSPSPSTLGPPSASSSPSSSPSPRTCGTAPSLPAGDSIRIEPYCTGVVEDGGFSVRVVQKAAVATSGITTSIVFDPAILQVVAITRSSAFAAAPIFAGAGASAISSANISGKLNQVAVSFFPPGNLPAGEADFITVEFKAITCGVTDLELPNVSTDSAILDGRPATYGIPLAIRTGKGVVQACDPEATPTPRPTPTPTPTPVPTPTPTPVPPQAPVIPPPPTPPATGGDTPPPESPTPEPPAPPAPAATATPVAVVITPTRPPSARPTALAMNTVAFVGLGVVGVFGGLLFVLLLAAAMAAGMVIPWLVVRARAGRRR